jgi:hypothetical protein
MSKSKGKYLLKECREKVKQLYEWGILLWIIIGLFLSFGLPFSRKISLIPKLFLLVPLVILLRQYSHVNDPEKKFKKEESRVEIIYPSYLLLFLIFKEIRIKGEACKYVNTLVLIILLLIIASSFDFYVPIGYEAYSRHLRTITWCYVGGLLMYVCFLVYVTFDKTCDTEEH